MTRYLALILAVLCIAPALADDNTGSVEGTLVGDRGKSVAHVTVVLDGDHGLQQSQTDENGHFVFLTVLPGQYAVESTGLHRISLRLGIVPGVL
ncbi:MAG: carboxypeptidase-like regulatory domain-containing protein [Vulcanimicrobiaceae bacterium]